MCHRNRFDSSGAYERVGPTKFPGGVHLPRRNRTIARTNGNATTVGHRLTRIENEIEKRTLELSDIHERVRKIIRQVHLELRMFTE